MFILKAITSYLKGSYDKPNLTRVVISYEIYETRRAYTILIKSADAEEKRSEEKKKEQYFFQMKR